MNLNSFKTQNFFQACQSFFEDLNIPVNTHTEESTTAIKILDKTYKDKELFNKIKDVYFVGMVDDAAIKKKSSEIKLEEIKGSNEKYEGLLVFGITLNPRDNKKPPSRGQLSEITRAFNQEYHYSPVILIFKYYINGEAHIALGNTMRENYLQAWREGEKIVKVSILKDIKIGRPHSGHLRIINQMRLNTNRHNKVEDFNQLNIYWASTFSYEKLNEDFYKEISAWYYHAVKTIKLPIKPAYIKTHEENVKNFTVRLISRLIFAWFLKEKQELINTDLLELYDYEGNIKPLLGTEDDSNFMSQSNYYKTILQNIFFNALNSPISEKRKKEYIHKDRLPDEFDFRLFDEIPFLNGGLFDKLEEDNVNDRSDDNSFYVPNELFYADEIKVQVGNKTLITEGINKILSSYKFTIEENTSIDEEIALDPELLGLVFENLLAELDPVEAVAKTARKESGSYYTPRKVIDYMVNETLLLYFKRSEHLQKYDEDRLKELVYFDKSPANDKDFCNSVLNAIDEIKIFDPACGSGAFPMGMLQRLVNIIHIIDPKNILWIEKTLSHIPPELHDKMRKDFQKHDLNYARKLGLIRNSIYGTDIQPLAVMISKLRFFISLLAEQDVDKTQKSQNYHISPFPNLETKIICADTLKDASPQKNMFFDETIEKIEKARNQYYKPEINQQEKDRIVHEIAVELNELYPYKAFGEKITGNKYQDAKSQKQANIRVLEKWFKNAAMAAPFFNENVFFPELHGKGFDIVIGNPPYGGAKISDDLKKQLRIESKDPYGAFIARFIGDKEQITPLKYNGVLSFIVSDTFMTIKSHKRLRQHIMWNYIHKMIRVHPDTFKATVNTAIIVLEKNKPDEDKKYVVENSHKCLMADLTRINIHENYHRFLELLYKTAGDKEITPESDIHFMQGNDWSSQSSSEYAIYTYPQNIIRRNSNMPFFVASPKLFSLMWDDNDVDKKEVKLDGEKVNAHLIEMNGKKVPIVKLGDIAEVKQGLATGDNESYLFQKPEGRGSYRSIDEYKDYLLTEKDLEKIRSNEKLRLSVIKNGISKDNPTSERYFGGRYIVPYDKGGSSDASGGWMPNYYVPTDYFIDWSEWAVQRMKNYTIADRIRDRKENKRILDHYEHTNCAVIRNPSTYFRKSISFSRTGVYSPTFRVNAESIYDTEGSMIFPFSDAFYYDLIAYLINRTLRFFTKNFIGHTVHTQVDEIKAVIVPGMRIKSLENKIIELIKNQKTNLFHDYASMEQLEIDRLVYEAYGLNDDDIREVENWYERRYPKLVEAQKRNLRKLGKPDDYVEIYQRLRNGEDLVS